MVYRLLFGVAGRRGVRGAAGTGVTFSMSVEAPPSTARLTSRAARRAASPGRPASVYARARRRSRGSVCGGRGPIVGPERGGGGLDFIDNAVDRRAKRISNSRND